MSYWSIRKYLAEQEPISVRFKVYAHNMQFLDPHKGFQGGIPALEPVELPLWRASNLQIYCEQNDLLEVMVPKNYDKKTFDFFESFRKDSCPNKSKVGVVNIKKKSNFYYDAGRMMAKLLSEELTFVRLKSLEDFYNERIIWIINRAIDTNDHENVEPYSKRFTYSENRIYREVFKNAIKHKDWEQRIKKRVGRKTLQDLKNGK